MNSEVNKTQLNVLSTPKVEVVVKNELADRVSEARVAVEAKTNAKERQSQDLQKAVEKINSFVQSFQRDLQFKIEESTGRAVITVLDSETKEVIRQIPPKEVLSIAKTLNSEGKVRLLKVIA